MKSKNLTTSKTKADVYKTNNENNSIKKINENNEGIKVVKNKNVSDNQENLILKQNIFEKGSVKSKLTNDHVSSNSKSLLKDKSKLGSENIEKININRKNNKSESLNYNLVSFESPEKIKKNAAKHKLFKYGELFTPKDVPGLEKIWLIVVRKDEDGNVSERKDFCKSELKRYKKLNYTPILLGILPSGQRDIFSIFYNKLCNLLLDETHEYKEFINNDNTKYKEFNSNIRNLESKEKAEYLRDIHDFLRGSVKCLEIEISTSIFLHIYLERILNSKKIQLNHKNLLNLLTVCLYLAYNFNEDVKFSTETIIKVLNIENYMLQNLSKIVLEDFLDWKLHITDEDYDSFIYPAIVDFAFKTNSIKSHIMESIKSSKIK